MKTLFLALCCILGFATTSLATETKIIVRAKAKDAKFIGSSIGGASVLIKDKYTGELLAKGLTEGSTGNTDLIMQTPHERGTSLTDDRTAKFEAVLDIDQPTQVIIEVYAPYNQKQATATASVEIWAIPGKHLLGDGIVLEIPGFIIDVLEPRTHQVISQNDLNNNELDVKANMVMMCGCPITDGGIWDANSKEVQAIIYLDGKQIATTPMNWTSTNLFQTKINVAEKGYYKVLVYGYDKDTGNTGVDSVNYIVN